jgi:hypothetical protein
MKKILLISSFAVFLLAGSVSYAAISATIEPTPIVQDDNTKAKESESSETKSECSSKKSECSKDCIKSCCKKKKECEKKKE